MKLIISNKGTNKLVSYNQVQIKVEIFFLNEEYYSN